MIANIRINLDIPDEKAKAFLERVEPGMAKRWRSENRADLEQIADALEEWVQGDLPSMLAEHATSDECEVDW